MACGSLQLRKFRCAIRDGATLEQACLAAGTLDDGSLIISLAEARIHIANDAKNPPPPEAFEIGPSAEETAMARAAEKEDGEGAGIEGEYKRPDAKGALKIYRDEIKPKNTHIATIKGDLSEPYKRIKVTCHFPRKVLDFLMQLDDMEDAKRDHWLLAFHSGLEELKLHLPSDLVTLAQGEDGGSVIPFGERKRPQLATLPAHDGDDSDLADAGDDDFDEASEDELAAQRDRPGNDDPEDEELPEAAE